MGLVGTVEDKADLPDKIFKDCQMCPRLHRCDEVAMVRGRIPRMSILGARQEAQHTTHERSRGKCRTAGRAKACMALRPCEAP